MASTGLIVDTGPLYALFDADDDHHARCRELLETHPGPLVVPQLVVAEATYLLASRLGTRAEVQLLGDLASGVYLSEPVTAADWLRIAELVVRYRELPLGTVDASVVATAERLQVVTVASTDRRHLTVVRPRHAPGLAVLP